jgi:hypothetical protein
MKFGLTSLRCAQRRSSPSTLATIAAPTSASPLRFLVASVELSTDAPGANIFGYSRLPFGLIAIIVCTSTFDSIAYAKSNELLWGKLNTLRVLRVVKHTSKPI